MSTCASCAVELAGDAALCPHHHAGPSDEWAVVNRIMCAFFHRKEEPARLPPAQRDDVSEFAGEAG